MLNVYQANIFNLKERLALDVELSRYIESTIGHTAFYKQMRLMSINDAVYNEGIRLLRWNDCDVVSDDSLMYFFIDCVRYPSLSSLFDHFDMGFTVWLEQPIILLNLPRLKNIDKYDFEKLIIHELVHYKQWQKKELDIRVDGSVWWKGKNYSETIQKQSDLYIVDYTSSDAIYRNTPWEKEAYSISHGVCYE